MTIKGKRIYSDWPIPPGEGLREEVEFRGISAQEMAALCSEPMENMEAVYRGTREITPASAEKLQEVLGNPAQGRGEPARVAFQWFPYHNHGPF